MPHTEDFEHLLDLVNVVGVDYNEHHDSVVAFVTEKVPEDELDEHQLVQTNVEGRDTDVQEVGEIKILTLLDTAVPDVQAGRKERHRPVPGGVSEINANSTAATGGPYPVRVTDTSKGKWADDVSKGDLVRCSNNHVYCFDSETDVLTDGGWKAWTDVTDEDRLASMENNGELVFEYPVDIHEFEYEGDMHHYYGRHLDLKVTPDHRMWVRPSCNSVQHGDWQFMRSEEVVDRFESGSTTTVQMKRDVEWNCTAISEVPLQSPGSGTLNNIGPDAPTDNFLTFLGWWIGDGSTGAYDHERRGVSYDTSIRCSDENAETIVEIVESLGLNVHYSDWDGYGQVTIHSKHLHEHLDELGGSSEKYIPRWVLDLPPEQLQHVYEGLIISDGHEYDTYDVYTTTSEDLANDVQELALKLGKVATISTQTGETEYSNGEITTYYIKCFDRFRTPSVQSVDIVEYEGTVYCATVPGGKLLVRRNGIPVWSGNSRVNEASFDEEIWQPSPYDDGTADDAVGTLAGYVPVKDGMTVDLAARTVDPEQEVVSYHNLSDSFPSGVKRDGWKNLLGTTLQKTGRTTGVSSGTVIGTSATVNVNYGEDHGQIKLRDQIITTAMSKGGDSGSPVFEKSSGTLVGELFAGSSMATISYKASNMESEFGIEVLTEEPDDPGKKYKTTFDTTVVVDMTNPELALESFDGGSPFPGETKTGTATVAGNVKGTVWVETDTEKVEAELRDEHETTDGGYRRDVEVQFTAPDEGKDQFELGIWGGYIMSSLRSRDPEEESESGRTGFFSM